MRIYPAVHYTMGGLWVDYNLMSNVPGLHVIGEANFSDHGANRLGASALMQGLADGYFIVPLTIGDYLGSTKLERVAEDDAEVRATEEAVRQRTARLLAINGKRTVMSIHRELGKLMWEYCGMSRDAAGLRTALGRDSEVARRVLARRARPGNGRGAQSVARIRRARRRFPGVRRTDVPRRAGPRGIVRRALPRRASDARRRSAARRRRASRTSPRGTSPAKGSRRRSTRSRSCSRTCTSRNARTNRRRASLS